MHLDHKCHRQHPNHDDFEKTGPASCSLRLLILCSLNLIVLAGCLWHNTNDGTDGKREINLWGEWAERKEGAWGYSIKLSIITRHTLSASPTCPHVPAKGFSGSIPFISLSHLKSILISSSIPSYHSHGYVLTFDPLPRSSDAQKLNRQA
ncbi:hypothetical protein BDZ97DRAFT_860019 [Flammula alnicola]|nr:hypothetical protein BDZ97DRAFT_860019 [Flammula alnicola]